jgi:RNA polymerase sigma-70 factor (ECF subfamily)
MALGVAGTDLITRARAGDEVAFSQLVDPYRRELQVHCYRILGSVQDAEDQVQETLLAAWQSLDDFAGRASIRTWLYRIATNRCLNALRSTRRRAPLTVPPTTAERPEPTRTAPVIWLEPCPDVLLDGVADSTPGPEARYEAKEAISLAFVTALQLLPPRQRAALVLCDVVGFPAKDVSRMLQSSPGSVASALKRARATLQGQLSAPQQPPPEPNSPIEQAIVARFTNAYEAGDVAALISLCTDDVVLTTPLAAGEYQGRHMAARLLAAVFRPGRTFRLIATRANRQPAFGVYVRDPHAAIAHANGLLVLTLTGGQISAMTRFDNSALPSFGFPRTLPIAARWQPPDRS